MMYTRCPECRTAFRITLAQLKAADGLVRCGRCDAVFRADLHLFAPAEGRAPERPVPAPSDVRPNVVRPRPKPAPRREDIPVVSDASLFQAPRRGLPAPVWALLALLAAATLVAQFGYFYRHELAQVPRLLPALERLCALLECDVRPPLHAVVPELLGTRIAAHPRYANALRLQARFVNRSDRAQPLPLMQVSFTDTGGRLLARRTFTPQEYLAQPADELAPNVVADARLDLTNPDEKASGYEVHLYAPRTRAR